MNGKQTVKLRSVSINFKNHFEQLAMLFEIYADFESLLKGVSGSGKNNNASSIEKNQKYVPCSFPFKGAWVGDKLNKSPVLYRGKKRNQSDFLKQF